MKTYDARCPTGQRGHLLFSVAISILCTTTRYPGEFFVYTIILAQPSPLEISYTYTQFISKASVCAYSVLFSPVSPNTAHFSSALFL